MKRGLRELTEKPVGRRQWQEDILAVEKWDPELDPFPFYSKCLKLCLVGGNGAGREPLRLGVGVEDYGGLCTQKLGSEKGRGFWLYSHPWNLRVPSQVPSESCTENTVMPGSPSQRGCVRPSVK